MTFKLKLDGAMLEMAIERAALECRNTGRDPGVSSLLKHALRYYLSKNGYLAADMGPIKNRPYPRTRTGTFTAGREAESENKGQK